VSNGIGDIYRQIKEPALRVLYRCWDETRGGRAAPAVVDIDPADLPVLQGSLAVVDTAERLDGFRFHYFGDALRLRFRQERRDMTFSQIKRIGTLKEPLEGYWTTYSECVATYLPLAPLAGDPPRISFSRLLLPIMGAESAPVRILAGFAFCHSRNRPAGSLAW
jgi:hypothetical protein